MCIYIRMDKIKLQERRESRFWSKIKKCEKTNCWEWTGGKDSDGYGVFYIAEIDNNQRAHRVAWKFTYGIEPNDLILHKCDNPACINPEHLFEGSHTDNMRDKSVKGRWKGKETYLEIDGVTKTLSEWAEISGIKRPTLWARLKRGKNPKDAISV